MGTRLMVCFGYLLEGLSFSLIFILFCLRVGLGIIWFLPVALLLVASIILLIGVHRIDYDVFEAESIEGLCNAYLGLLIIIWIIVLIVRVVRIFR